MGTVEVWTPRSGGRSKPASRSSSIGSAGSGGSGSNIEYTSLRDMLLEGSGSGGGGSGGTGENGGGGFRAGSWRECNSDNIHEFDPSNIGIRNQLLKHAASAYLQSAVVVGGGAGGREGHGCCLIRLWRRVAGAGRVGGGRGRVLVRACPWQGCAIFAARVAAFFTGSWVAGSHR